MAQLLTSNFVDLDRVLNQAIQQVDLDRTDGISLLHYRDPGAIEAIRSAADQLRQISVGDRVSYVNNRNINYSNICEQHCSFCAFRRDADQPGAYWLEWEVMAQKTEEAIGLGATEICMQGGLNPEAKIDGKTLNYYIKLVETIKFAAPDVHLHAFSPQEIQFIARQDNLSYVEVIEALQTAGLGSMPGTAAEVLDDEVRAVLCPEKTDSATWIEIIRTAHRLGLPTTSTMMSGHIETIDQQIDHLLKLRYIQQTAPSNSAKISEFILLPFVGQMAPKPLRRRVGRDQPILADALLLTAVARLVLGPWIVNHQPSWVKLGLDGATEALRWGCNDIGGTLMEEHITSMAGAQGGTNQTVEALRGAIESIGRSPYQRDTLYQDIGPNVGPNLGIYHPIILRQNYHYKSH
jgi:5-amino-6-(D-ribitylamino)uracil---L-tyrosine 4-hydroxyphenyl transferase